MIQSNFKGSLCHHIERSLIRQERKQPLGSYDDNPDKRPGICSYCGKWLGFFFLLYYERPADELQMRLEGKKLQMSLWYQEGLNIKCSILQTIKTKYSLILRTLQNRYYYLPKNLKIRDVLLFNTDQSWQVVLSESRSDLLFTIHSCFPSILQISPQCYTNLLTDLFCFQTSSYIETYVRI